MSLIESDPDVSPSAGLPKNSDEPDRHWVRIVGIGNTFGQTACGLDLSFFDKHYLGRPEWHRQDNRQPVLCDDYYQGGEDAVTCRDCLDSLKHERALRKKGYNDDGSLL
jgi:hypothetical protein